MTQHKWNEKNRNETKTKVFPIKVQHSLKMFTDCCRIIGSNIHGIHKIFEHYVRREEKPV